MDTTTKNDLIRTAQRHHIVGEDDAFLQTLQKARRIAATEASVLLLGPTGSGKEVIARFIHQESSRADGRFEAVNCAGFTAELINSELFGHEKGSFTGAMSKKLGSFELASNGTLFLDELGTLSLENQARLLRAIQEMRIRRIGGTEDIPVNPRIIAATNLEIYHACAEDTFRDDLVHRFRTKIGIPALSERRSDIPLLAERLLGNAAETIRKGGARVPKRLSDEAVRKLTAHSWPGNIRELENCLYNACLDAEGADEVTIENIEFEEVGTGSKPQQAKPYRGFDLKDYLENERSRLISEALDMAGGNMSEASKFLGLSRQAIDQWKRKRDDDPVNRG